MNHQGHRVWAEVDLAALRRNLRRVCARLGGGAQVLAVVKADAYGHGAVPVARALQNEPGLWGFGVGDSHEALELRAAGLEEPVLVLGTIIDDEVPQVVSHDVRVSIHSMDRIQSLAAESERQGRRTRVHLMVDTGMGRLGAQTPRAVELARAINASPWLELEGLATHASASRPGHPFIDVQRDRLRALSDQLEQEGMRPPLSHFSNTAALLGGVGGDLPLVRPGISLYGILGPEQQAVAPDVEPVMSLRTQVVYLKDVPPGTPVGYNGTHVTTRTTRIATLPIGYNDGFAYRLSNRGRALVRGELAPVVGAVSMDYTTLDVGHIPGVAVGDTVTLIGRDGAHALQVPELASLVGTIPYEIVCSVGKRVKRVYLNRARSEAPPQAGSKPSTNAEGEA
ncbi:MAG: alanine racemase [Planctomycetota bacterium]|nr:MAG: alanine racemase [Planctomycetota bacterium]